MNTSFNVRDFGAVGDGKTDDTKAFQAALNAAGKCMGIVIVDPGIYCCSQLHMRRQTALQGSSAWSFRSFGSSILRLNDEHAACLLDLTGAFGCRISGMSLDGNGLGQNIHGISVCWERYNGGSEEDTPTIDDCKIGHFTGDGVHFEHIWCFSIRHSMIFANQKAGLYIDGWDAFLIDNWFTGNGQGGLKGGPSVASITATGNRVEWNRTAGFYLPNANCCNITGNYFDRSGGPGMVLGSKDSIAESVTVTGNIFYRSGKPQSEPFDPPEMSSHLHMEHAKNCVISGNVFKIGRDDKASGEFSPDYSVILRNSSFCLLQNNTMHEAALVQNLIEHNNTSCIIKDNIGEIAVPTA